MRALIIIITAHTVLSQLDEFYPVIPEKCKANANVMYRSCCVFPPFFTREVAKECGAGLELMFVDEKHNVTGFRRKALNDCDHWWCVLDKYSLLTRDGYLDDDKYYAHLDLWVGLNPMFADAMMEAKVHCRQNVRLYLPLMPCEFFHLHGCIRNFLNIDCPVTVPTQECEQVKEYYKECKEYYQKK
ncbi:uncharacterized protein LOC113505300 [Trichoplusia ni]|uniref:Uncharacterized protein LOC113505300 n=1 Tax=Trichoplusia ni TaxID=7111 RepID=A0A7E5WSG4_TRINI|nr:uncharacterized protein LOC113505300 [Trichoplusia ni]